MFRIRMISLLTAVLCLVCMAAPVRAAQVDCGSVYCFGTNDFSGEDDLIGICITALPETDVGTVCLGDRVIRTGDILTAQQAAAMTFTPCLTQTDREAQMEYLPVFADHVAEKSAMTLNIRGKEDKAPVAEDSTAETYKNLPNTAKLKAADPEQQPLTYSVVRQPRRGTVTIGDDGSFTYTPKKNKVGVDSFSYTAADPSGNVSREATVTITILKPTAAAQYTDTAGRECRFAAEWMKHTGIFVGESLGDQSCFQPDKAVTRGEFVTMLVRTLELPVEESVTYTGYTDDVPTWLRPYLAAAIRSGLTDGLADQQTFGANVPITGAEATVMLENALDQNADFLTVTEEILTRDQASQILYQCAKLAEETDTVV